MVGTNLLAAETIARVIGLPAARDVETFADGQVHMAELEIGAESPVADQTVQEADRFESLTFAAIIRNGDVEIPTGSARIRVDDDVVVIGSRESVQQFATAVPRTSRGRGTYSSSVGATSATTRRDSSANAASNPDSSERDPDRAREIAEALPETTVLESDATDREFLERENIDDVETIVAALDNDEKNLLAGLLAKRLGANRAVAVVEDGEYVPLFEAVGIDVAVNPREATAEEITRFTRARRAENVALIEHDKAEVLEIEVGPDSVLVDRPISESVADLPAGVVIGAITRDGEFVIPRGDTIIRENDHVVCFLDASIIDEATEGCSDGRPPRTPARFPVLGATVLPRCRQIHDPIPARCVRVTPADSRPR